MPDRPSFPIPDDLTPETFCLCLEIPNDPIWKAVISGLLFQPAEWFNWQRDEARSGKILAQYWRNIYNEIDWSTMSCCCPEPYAIRITSDGVYETSPDGVVWTPDISVDPRRGGTMFPPYPSEDTDNAKCIYADSVVKKIKNEIVDVLTEGMTTDEIITLVTSVIAPVFSPVVPGVIGAIILAVMIGTISLILIATITAFQAAMTTAVWNRFRCNLYNHMATDGSFSETQVDLILTQIDVDETGLANLFLSNIISSLRSVGLSNLAHIGAGASDADCDSCDSTAEVWVTDSTGMYFLITPDETGLYTATGEQLSGGKYYLNVAFAEDPDDCAIGNSITIVSYDGDEGSYDVRIRQGDCVNDALALCYALRQRRSSAPFALTFTLDSSAPCTA